MSFIIDGSTSVTVYRTTNTILITAFGNNLGTVSVKPGGTIALSLLDKRPITTPASFIDTHLISGTGAASVYTLSIVLQYAAHGVIETPAPVKSKSVVGCLLAPFAGLFPASVGAQISITITNNGTDLPLQLQEPIIHP